MTIETEAITSGPHPGNDVTTTFGFAFKIFADSDVLVMHTLALVDRIAVLGTDYLVTRNVNQDQNPGGEITWRINGVTAALPAGASVTITSQVPLTQQTALPTGGSYNAKVLEAMIDKLTILVKQAYRFVQRSVRQPVTDAVLMNELPGAASRRAKFLYFDDTAAAQPTAVENLATASVPVSTFMRTVLDDIDAAAARTTLGALGGTITAFAQTLLDDADEEAARATLELHGVTAPGNPAPAAYDGISTQSARADHAHLYQIESFIIAVSDEITALTAGAAKIKFRMPYAFTLTEAPRGSLSTAQASGSLLTIDVNENGVSVLGTKLTFDNTETTTTTALTAATITDAALANDAEISVDIDTVGTSGAKGLKIALIGRRAS